MGSVGLWTMAAVTPNQALWRLAAGLCHLNGQFMAELRVETDYRSLCPS